MEKSNRHVTSIKHFQNLTDQSYINVHWYSKLLLLNTHRFVSSPVVVRDQPHRVVHGWGMSLPHIKKHLEIRCEGTGEHKALMSTILVWILGIYPKHFKSFTRWCFRFLYEDMEFHFKIFSVVSLCPTPHLVFVLTLTLLTKCSFIRKHSDLPISSTYSLPHFTTRYVHRAQTRAVVIFTVRTNCTILCSI